MILEDCLDLLNVCSVQDHSGLRSFSERLKKVSRSMIYFLLGMTHPTGQIALFNDSAFGIEAPPVDLADYYERLTSEDAPKPSAPIWSFRSTGYFVMAPRTGDRLLIDCGPIGPDYDPYPAHVRAIRALARSATGPCSALDAGRGPAWREIRMIDDPTTERYGRCTP